MGRVGVVECDFCELPQGDEGGVSAKWESSLGGGMVVPFELALEFEC
jgi:hypothetical protein